MAQPKFTWWPWRTLSALVGAAACLLPLGVWSFGVRGEIEGEEAVMVSAFSIFAGGNALILGTAIGDFGRTVLALLIGVGMACGFSFLPTECALLAPFVIMTGITASLSMDRTLPGFAASAVLGLGASLIGFMMLCLAWLLLGGMLSLGLGGETAVAALPFACAAGNVFVVGFLFNAAHRVRTDRPRGGVEDRIGESVGSEKPAGAEGQRSDATTDEQR